MILLGALGMLLLAQPDDPAAIEDLMRRARNEYAYGNYSEAVKELRALLYPMKLSTDAQVVEARKYLALSYYLLGRRHDVEEEFTKLLYLDPDHELDPFSVAPAVIELFESVRRGLKEQLDSVRQRKSEERLAPPRPGTLRVVQTRSLERSDLATFMPFGIGQFQNGELRNGLLFCIAEVALLAVNVGAYVWGLNLDHYNASQRGLVRTLNVTQYASLALLGGVWGAGVLQARLAFVPVLNEPPEVHDEVPEPGKPLSLLLTWSY